MIAGRVINIIIGICLMLGALTQLITKYPEITPIYMFNIFIFVVSLAIVGYHAVKLLKERTLAAEERAE